MGLRCFEDRAQETPTLTSEDDRVGRLGGGAKAGYRGLDIQLGSNSSSRKRAKEERTQLRNNRRKLSLVEEIQVLRWGKVPASAQQDEGKGNPLLALWTWVVCSAFFLLVTKSSSAVF